jgi:hypothetical protein
VAQRLKLFCGSAVGSLSLAILLAFAVKPSATFKAPVHRQQTAVPQPPVPDVARPSRRNYRLSVVAGGVYSAAELRESRAIDRVVDSHYTDFGSDIELNSLSRDAYMYVSYRRGDHVYWTRRRHRVPKGEPVLTDGKNLARMRCGNRLSMNPRLPVAAGDEPSEPLLSEVEPRISKHLGDAALWRDTPLEAPDLYISTPVPVVAPALHALVSGPKLQLSGLDSMESIAGSPPLFVLSSPSAVPGTFSTKTSNDGSPQLNPVIDTGSPVGTTVVAPPETVAVPEPSSVSFVVPALTILAGTAYLGTRRRKTTKNMHAEDTVAS